MIGFIKKLFGPKVDLLEKRTLEEVQSILPLPADFYTSAKEGKDVEKVFLKLAQDMINGNK